MKAVRFLLVLVAVALVFVFGFGYGRWYSTRPAAAKNVRKILYYVDAMHPWYKSDKPGIAPDCGMALEPVYAGEAPPAANGEGPPPNTMLVGQDKQQLIGLRYGQAEWVTEGQTIRAAGRVAADETQISRVHSKVEGWIEHVSADFTGTVDSERPAAAHALQSRDAGQPAGTAAGAEGARRDAPQLADRNGRQQRIAGGGRAAPAGIVGPHRRAMAEVERTGKPIKSITLYSPATGYLTARNAFPGQKTCPRPNSTPSPT